MPMLEDEVGHVFQYNLSIDQAVSQIGWNFIGYVPRSTQVKDLPPNWRKNLPHDYWKKEKTLKTKLSIFFKNIPVYVKIFKKASKKNSIIFLEHFSLFHLLAILIASSLYRHNIELWLLYRYLPNKKKIGLFRSLFRWYNFFLGKNKVKLLTDSELLANEFIHIFQKKINVIPIPHAAMSTQKAHEKNNSLYLWWPGGSIRKEKGINEIRKIIKELVSSQCALVLANSAKHQFESNSTNIIYIPTELSRNEYEKWMNTSDIILLPYDPTTYSHSTSGIFVEAILAKKMPVVKNGSWLAHELKRFNLNELIIDWEKNNLLNHIRTLFHSRNTQKKLLKMHESYKAYHSLENVSKTLKSLHPF